MENHGPSCSFGGEMLVCGLRVNACEADSLFANNRLGSGCRFHRAPAVGIFRNHNVA